jgi:hypothetical protein
MDLRKRGWKAIEADLQQRGLASTSLGRVELEPGLTGKTGRALRQFNEFTMKAYSGTDVANRKITAETAALWADALNAGSKPALAALERLPTGFKVRLRQAPPEQWTDILADYLIGRTQFRYGRETMNEFGRDMGSAFSMFTKWPVMVASDIVDTFQRNAHKGTLPGAWAATQRLGTKYMAPLAALYAANEALQNITGDETGGPPRGVARFLLGKDITEISPLMSVKAIDILANPALELGRDFVSAPGDASKSRTVLRRGIKTLMPGAQILNELDRWSEAHNPGEATPSRELVNKITGGD